MADAPERSDQFLRRLFYTIIRGSSRVSHKKQDLFIKHFTLEEQGHIEGAYFEAFDKAQNEGLDTEEDCYKFLREEGIWTSEEEEDLRVQKDYLESLQETRKKLAVPGQIENITNDMRACEKKIEKIEIRKRELLPETCESYAHKKSNDLVIYYSYYKDEDAQEKLFSWQDYCELTPAELRTFFELYSSVAEELTIDNIKHLALSDFFSLYSNALGSKNIHQLLGKPMVDHTFYQLHMLNYAKVFNSILENVSDIPDKAKSDPDLLLDYASGSAKAEEMKEKSQGKSGYSVMGASAKEMRDMGIGNPADIDIHTLAAKKGGTLTMDDFVNLS